MPRDPHVKNNKHMQGSSSNTEFRFQNCIGVPYKRGNVRFFSAKDDILAVPMSNRVSLFNTKQFENVSMYHETKADTCCVAVNPQNTILLSSDTQGQCVASLLSSRAALHYMRFKKKVKCIEFNSTGSHFAACVGNKVYVYQSVQLYKQLHPFNCVQKYGGFESSTTCIEWDDRNNFIFVGSKDCTFRLFDTAKYGKRHRFAGVVVHAHKSLIVNIHLNRLVAGTLTVDRDGVIHQWELEQTDENYKQPSLQQKAVLRLKSTVTATDCGGSFLVAATVKNSKNSTTSDIFVVSLFDLTVTQQLSIGTGIVINSVSLNSHGNLIALASKKFNQIAIYDLNSSSFLVKHQSHQLQITCLAYSYDGRVLVTGSADGQVKLFTVGNGFCFATFSEHKGAVTDICFSEQSGNSFFVSSSVDGTCKAYDMVRCKCFRTFSTGSGSTHLSCVAIDSASEIVAAANNTMGADDASGVAEIYVWSVLTSRLLDCVSPGHTDVITGLRFESNSLNLISCSLDKSLIVTNLADNCSLVNKLNLTSEIYTMAVNPVQTSVIAVATCNGECLVYKGDKITAVINVTRDLGQARSVSYLTAKKTSAENHATAIDFSPTGTSLIVAGKSRFVLLYACTSFADCYNLVKRIVLTHNVAVPGVLAKLNSKNDKNKNEVIKKEKKVVFEVVKNCLRFAPSGRSFVVGTRLQESPILLYSLDENFEALTNYEEIFTPYDLSEEVTEQSMEETIKALNTLLNVETCTKAVVYAVKLNSLAALERVFVMVPDEIIQVMIEGAFLNRTYILKVLNAVGILLENKSRNAGKLAVWCRHGLKALCGEYMKNDYNVRSTHLNLLKLLEKNLNVYSNGLVELSESNLLLLDYILK